MTIEHYHWNGLLGECPTCKRRVAPEVWFLDVDDSYDDSKEASQRVCRQCLTDIYDDIGAALGKEKRMNFTATLRLWENGELIHAYGFECQRQAELVGQDWEAAREWRRWDIINYCGSREKVGKCHQD